MDPGDDYWPADCATAEERALLDVAGESIAPSAALRTALSVTDRIGFVGDRRLTVPGVSHGRVVIGHTTSNEVFAAIDRGTAGAPILLAIDRTDLSTTNVTVTNFPTAAGTAVIDLAMADVGGALRLALLLDAGTENLITWCDLGASCALSAPLTVTPMLDPELIAIVREDSMVQYVTAGPPAFGSGVCMAQDDELEDLCNSALDLDDVAGDGAESTGGLFALFPTLPTLYGALFDRSMVNLVAYAAAGAFEDDDSRFSIVSARAGTAAGTFDIWLTDTNCLGGGGCLPLDADEAAFEAESGTPEFAHASALTERYAFFGVGNTYADPGADVRLYAVDGEAGLPLNGGRFVTMSSGRVAATRTELRSFALTALFDGSSYDVIEVSVTDAAGVTSVYLSGLRYCR